MTDFSIATFNVKNLIGADKEYYKWERYTPEEYAWKRDWLSDQLLALDADIVGFQEVFEESALREVIDETEAKGDAVNDRSQPDPKARYARKMIFRRLRWTGYQTGGLAWFGNIHDGEPGERRPGLAILSRHPFAEPPVAIQDLSDDPVELRFAKGAGAYRLTALSRPVIKARIDIGGRVVTVFNCHFKSKLGEYELPRDEAPEANLLDYDPVGRALGEARSLMRRAAEAAALRRLIVAELEMGRPVIALGDFNDGDTAVSSAVVAGEKPFKNYAWMRRHDAKRPNDRYTDEENERIQRAVRDVMLESAERMFIRKSSRDMIYTSAFGGVYESIDQILVSRHFQTGARDQAWEMDYLSVLNDHLTDGAHPEAPYNKLASDHGQLVARFGAL